MSAVLALEVDQPALVSIDDHLGVVPRDTEILDDDIAVGGTAEDHAPQIDGDRALATFLLVCQLEHQEWICARSGAPRPVGNNTLYYTNFRGPASTSPTSATATTLSGGARPPPQTSQNRPRSGLSSGGPPTATTNVDPNVRSLGNTNPEEICSYPKLRADG